MRASFWKHDQIAGLQRYQLTVFGLDRAAATKSEMEWRGRLQRRMGNGEIALQLTAQLKAGLRARQLNQAS